LISPALFIPLAENYGQISDITTFVTKEAIRQLGVWKREGLKINMSVNISPAVLTDLELPEKLEILAEEMGTKNSDIVIEITETALTTDLAKFIDILTRLRIKGFNFSIDDFGTGYSSLQQLVRIPFNELKIDQAFIDKMESDEECRTIVEISILLAKKLNMNVIAEGVENKSTWEALDALGCDEGQGYWMAKPMAAVGINPDWIEQWNARFN